VNLNLNAVENNVPSSDAMHASREKLGKLNQRDENKKLVEQRKHVLESGIYDMYDKLDMDSIATVSTDPELEKIRQEIQEVGAWFDEEGWQATAGDLQEKIKVLNGITSDLLYRHEEYLNRPEAIEEFENALDLGYKLKDIPETDRHFNDTHLAELNTALDEHKNWLAEMREKQKQLPLHEKPVLLTKDLRSKTSRIVKHIVRVKSVPKPKPPPKQDDENNATNVDNEEATSSSESDESAKPDKSETENDAEKKEQQQPDEKSDDAEPSNTQMEEEVNKVEL